MKFEPLLDGFGGSQFAVAPDSIAMTEVVGTLTGTTPDLDPDDPDVGSIALWTLTGNSTPVDTLTDGQSMTLMIDDGNAYSITWPTMTWVGGSAPTLATTGYTVIVLWKVGTSLRGMLAGSVA
jgi:hypothetical protein